MNIDKNKVIALSAAAVLGLSQCACGGGHEPNTRTPLFGLFYGYADYYMPEDVDLVATDDLGAGEVDFAYFPEGEEEMSYIAFQTAAYEPETAAATIKGWYGITEISVEELSGEQVFTHHIFGENDTGYYETYMIIGENAVTGEPCYYEICLTIDKARNADRKEAMLKAFHTMIESMRITFCAEKEYNALFEGE